METVGWVIAGFKFTKFSAGGATFDVNEVIIKLLEAIGTGNDIAIAAETLEALKALSDDDGRVVLFNTESSSLDKGNFQIALAAESDDVVVLKVGAFYFSTSENVTRVLWFRFSGSSTSFYMGSQTINLNDEIYEQVRQSVIEKLGANAKTKVDGFDI